MTSTNFSLKSLHWRLASVYGTSYSTYKYDETGKESEMYEGDICDYVQSCLLGLVVIFVCTAIVGLVLGSVTDFIVWAIVSFQYSMLLTLTLTLNTYGMVGGILLAAVACVAVAYGLDKVFKKVARERREAEYARLVAGGNLNDEIEKRINPKPKPESFVKAVYRKFKDKTCFKVTVS